MPTSTPKPQPSNDNQPAARQQRTPDTDMQPEDAGTAESQPAAAGTPAQKAMKQQSKTPQERGSGR